MKVLLITMPYLSDKYRGLYKRTPATLPLLGVAYIAAVLEKHNIPVKLLDAWGNGLTFDDIRQEIETYSPDIIGISCVTTTFGIAVDLAKKIRLFSKNIQIVIGGPLVSAIPAEVLEQIPWIDIVVIGEGEYTMLELAQGKNLSSIKGIAFRQQERIIITEARPLLDNLDELPFPARHFYNLSNYNRPFFEFHGKPYTTIVTSRGCPFKCKFCASHVVAGKQVRLRSISNIVEEIDSLIAKYNVKFISIADDAPVFTMNQDRLLEFCKAIKGKKFTWGAKARADSINEENLSVMSKAGCRELEIGCESGNPDILKDWDKGVTVTQVQKAFSLMRKYGINSVALFMLGAPNETEESVRQTIDFIIRLNPTYVIATILHPYPGSDAFEFLYKHNMLKRRDWEDIRNPQPESPALSDPLLSFSELNLPYITYSRLRQLQSQLHRQYYSNPKYILSSILRFKNPQTFGSYMKLFFRILYFRKKWLVS
jgi:radical SAM superfamily enzyme YgiQ (UPF0313 family)